MSIAKLIAAVEAGLPQQEWQEDGFEDGLVWINIPAGIFSSQQLVLILSAYNSSLDAAKALHDALATGWRMAQLCERTDGIWSCRLYGPNPQDGVYAEADYPARAWLLAILKKLEAEGRG